MGKKDVLSEQAKDRLNVLMRPADGVWLTASSMGLLAEISESRDPVAALAYVFATQPFAYWSGPETPAGQFPKPFDDKPGSRDAEEFEAFQSDVRVKLRFEAVVAQIRADEPDADERAKRAWEFLGTVDDRVGRVVLLGAMLASDVLVSAVTPFTGSAPYNEPIPDAEYDDILWRNRGVIGILNGICRSGAVKTSTAFAAALLAALSEIKDERERAVILGNLISRVRGGNVGDPVTALLSRIVGPGSKAILDAAERGEPCPDCGRVHGSKHGDEHKD